MRRYCNSHGDLVVLGLAAVNRLHVQRMAEHESNALGLAEIGKPVPGEHAFAGDDEPVAIRPDRLAKNRDGRGTASLILCGDLASQWHTGGAFLSKRFGSGAWSLVSAL
jgi:hypothetical protein